SRNDIGVRSVTVSNSSAWSATTGSGFGSALATGSAGCGRWLVNRQTRPQPTTITAPSINRRGSSDPRKYPRLGLGSTPSSSLVGTQLHEAELGIFPGLDERVGERVDDGHQLRVAEVGIDLDQGLVERQVGVLKVLAQRLLEGLGVVGHLGLFDDDPRQAAAVTSLQDGGQGAQGQRQLVGRSRLIRRRYRRHLRLG